MLRFSKPHQHDSKTATARPSQSNPQLNDEIVQQIVELRDHSGTLLIEKYSSEAILSSIEKNQIDIIELFGSQVKEGFNLMEFVRFFMSILGHSPIENLHLAIGLTELFREITMRTPGQKVVLKQLTDYMCDRIIRDQEHFNPIEAKHHPPHRPVKPSSTLKSYLKAPPTLSGQSQYPTHKLAPKAIKTDSSKHPRTIISSQFSPELKKVMVLESLGECICVYNEQCRLQRKIRPVGERMRKEVVILGFAWSERQLRMGAVLKDFTMKMWDHHSNFEYEKSILTTSASQNLQSHIFYLESYDTWTTADRTGTLHFWDLLTQLPSRSLNCKHNVPVTALCPIAPQNLLAVVQDCRKGESGVNEPTVAIYNFYNGYVVAEIQLTRQRIPHTIAYSEQYRCIFMGGLQKKIKIYELHPQFMDVSGKGQLVGHDNLITAFTLVAGTPMLASADDKGKLKLWDYRTRTCMQTLDLSNRTVITNLLDMASIGQLGVFGSRINYISFEDSRDMQRQGQSGKPRIESVEADLALNQMYLFGNRQVRVVDLLTGQTKHIYSFVEEEGKEEVNLFKYLPCTRKFILASSGGQIGIYGAQTGQLQRYLLQSHEGSVVYLEWDELNKLVISAGIDSRILVHKSWDGRVVRELRNNFGGREITAMDVSVYHNVIAIGSQGCGQIYVWHYEHGKMIGAIDIKEESPIGIHMMNGPAIVAVGTHSGKIYLLAMSTPHSALEAEFNLIASITAPSPLSTIQATLSCTGRGRHAVTSSCYISAITQDNELVTYDCSSVVAHVAHKIHAKHKTNYNPLKEGKENFATELQKIQHSTYKIPVAFFEPALTPSTIHTDLQVTSLKVLQLPHPIRVVAGNDTRLKVWDDKNKLACDLNIQHCLPYKWQLRVDSKNALTEKVFYGIKLLQTIAHKYDSDISIQQSKNLEIRQLFNYIEAHNEDNAHLKMRMITEPAPDRHSLGEERREVMLMQDEYTRKDLNFNLVKEYNFTEIAGPSLQELDQAKKIALLQKDWRDRAEEETQDRSQLLKNIEHRARKNEEKDHLQSMFLKQKKLTTTAPVPQEDHPVLRKLKQHLVVPHSQPTQPHLTPQRKTAIGLLAKNIHRHHVRRDTNTQEKGSRSEATLPSRSLSRQKKHTVTFEEYYSTSQQQVGRDTGTASGFRQILTQMNGRVKSMRKQRYRNNLSNA